MEINITIVCQMVITLFSIFILSNMLFKPLDKILIERKKRFNLPDNRLSNLENKKKFILSKKKHQFNMLQKINNQMLAKLHLHHKTYLSQLQSLLSFETNEIKMKLKYEQMIVEKNMYHKSGPILEKIYDKLI